MWKKEKIYLIDWYNFIYRLFYAIPPFTLKDWTPINTVFWMAKIVLAWYNEDKPDYLVFILDHKWKTFREELYADYKWTRDKMPSDLKTQENLIMELLAAFNIPTISMAWYEADDIIGTLATKYRNNPSKDVYILSWDKDLFQFICDNVKIYDTMKRKMYTREDSFEKFWVFPEHVVDYLSICWDSSDNIPWIPWFWPKKAQELISKYWNLEEIYEHVDEITWKTQEILIANKETALLSKQLASINTTLELKDFNLDNHIFSSREIYNENVIDIFKRFEFKSLIPHAHKDEIKNFSSLGLKIDKISTQQELDDLKNVLLKQEKMSISTSARNPFTLDTIDFYIGGKNIYSVSTSVIDIREVLKEIMNSDIEIISFDLKEDYKRIKSYTENLMMSGWWSSEIQSSLF